MRRAPDTPYGWPTAIAPPFDVEPIVGNAERVARVDHLHGERLVQLPQVDVGDLHARALEQLAHREHGTDAHLVGLAAGDGEAAEDAERREAALRGRRSLITTQADAPSENWLALPAATVPPGRAGLIFDDAFVASCRRGCPRRRRSSPPCVTMRAGRPCRSTPIVTVIGTISSSKRPAACAAAARCWLCSAVLVLTLARDAVAARHRLRGLEHRPVDRGLVRREPRLATHVLVHARSARRRSTRRRRRRSRGLRRR